MVIVNFRAAEFISNDLQRKKSIVTMDTINTDTHDDGLELHPDAARLMAEIERLEWQMRGVIERLRAKGHVKAIYDAAPWVNEFDARIRANPRNR